MSRSLPSISRQRFHRDLLAASPVSLSTQQLSWLYEHYLELQRWNRTHSLVGPATAEEIIQRHYGESLAALPLIGSEDRTLVDLGSGAGFPGFVLLAARPDLQVTLVEPRQKKWAFLMTVARRTALSCRCLNARVERPLAAGFPDEVDLVTVRALRLSPGDMQALLSRLSTTGRFLLWVGTRIPELPPNMRPGRSLAIPGSRSRRVLELRRRDR